MGRRDGIAVLRDAWDEDAKAIRVKADGLAWQKFTIPYADLIDNALQTVALYSLPAGGVVSDAKIKHSVAFAGPALATMTVEVGIAGSTEKYLAPFDVMQAVGATVQAAGKGRFLESHAAATPIIATLKSTGANLTVATAGSVDIWLLTSKAV